MAAPRTSREQELLAPDVTRGAYFFLDFVARRVGPVKISLGGRETCGENYVVDRVSYPFPTLEFVAEGEGTVTYDGAQPIRLGPGAVFAHGPGVNLRMTSVAGAALVKYFLCFSGRGARRLIDRYVPASQGVVTLPHHAELREYFELMLREGTRQTPFAQRICDQLSRALLLKIGDARRHPRGDARDRLAQQKFLRCKALIDENGARFESLEQIAAALHADTSGLSRLFRRYQGMSPYQYLLRHKMNLAAEDLIRTGALVKEVAARAGYPDAYHFSRVFKGVHGIAPAHFQRLGGSADGE